MGSGIDPAAVEIMTKKRSMESSSGLAEASPKRPCTSTSNDSDSFEEFFALLQRIEATKRHCSRSRGTNRKAIATKCSGAGKIEDAKAITSQALWRPSFEWEDFLPRGNGTRDVDCKAGEQGSKGRESEQERVSAEASVEGDKGLDLNLPLELTLL